MRTIGVLTALVMLSGCLEAEELHWSEDVGGPRCMNGVQDEDETSTDCGGTECQPCIAGDGCLVNTDCETDYCHPEGVCLSQTCRDGVQNDGESQVDCGGACMPCGPNSCYNGEHDPETETGVDCGDTCPVRCRNGDGCVNNSDCESGWCYDHNICDEPA